MSNPNPFGVPTSPEAMSALTKQTFDTMSSAYSGWLRNATKVQAEAIRFINDRFTKDIEMMSQFAQCKKPEDIAALQAKLVSSLVADYTAESTKIIALFSDVAKEGLEGLTKTAANKPGS
jgi:Phasin protein